MGQWVGEAGPLGNVVGHVCDGSEFHSSSQFGFSPARCAGGPRAQLLFTSDDGVMKAKKLANGMVERAIALIETVSLRGCALAPPS